MTALPLLATLTALICGPLLFAVARRQPSLVAFLDGFVLLSIAGLVLLEVVPGAYSEGGLWSLAFLLLGAMGPSLVEHTLERARREAHLATLALAILGLLLHSVGDGIALSAGDAHGQGHEALAVAVVVHSLPVGLAVWWVMAPVFGPRWPAVTLALMCAGTVAGFVFGTELSAVLGTRGFAWFQALVAGSILHVVFGRPHLQEDSEHRDTPPPFEGLGNLFALGGLFALDRLDPHAAGLPGLLGHFMSLWLRAAPALLLAYVLAGWIEVAREAPARSHVPIPLATRLSTGLIAWVDVSAPWVLATLAGLALLLADHLLTLPIVLRPGLAPLLAALLAVPLYRRAPRQAFALVVLLGATLSLGAAVALVIAGTAAVRAARTRQALPRLTLFALLILIATALGTGIDVGLPTLNLLPPATSVSLALLCVVLLAGLFLASLLRCGGRRWLAVLMEPHRGTLDRVTSAHTHAARPPHRH